MNHGCLTNEWPIPVFKYGAYKVSREYGEIVEEGYLDAADGKMNPLLIGNPYGPIEEVEYLSVGILKIKHGAGYVWVDDDCFKALEKKASESAGFLTLACLVKEDGSLIRLSHYYWSELADARELKCYV